MDVSGTWTLIQSNDFTAVVDLAQTTVGAQEIINGSAESTPTSGGDSVQGSLAGLLQDNQLTFTIVWTNGDRGLYIINEASEESLDGYGYEPQAPTAYATFTGARS